jgi:hypothetical protein
MQYAHDKMNRDELDQVRRHWAEDINRWERYVKRTTLPGDFQVGLTTRVLPQAVPELDTFDYEPVDVWTVNGRTI